MAFPYVECKKVLLDGLLASLTAKEALIRSMRTETGYHTASGLDFELVPWHDACHLSLRSFSDPIVLEYPHDPDSWKYGYFVQSQESSGESLKEAARMISALYNSRAEETNGLLESAHMIFLAGADALLDPSVAKLLQSMGVNAPIITDFFPKYNLWYTVYDSDATFKANYCEIVFANRIAARLLSNEAQY